MIFVNTSHKFTFIFQLPIVRLSVEYYIDIEKYYLVSISWAHWSPISWIRRTLGPISWAY